MRPALLLMLLGFALPARAWDTLAPGIRYTTILDGAGQAFELDLAVVELRVAEARTAHKPTLAAADFAKGTGAHLAVNGGFFDERSAPLGLLVSGGRSLSRLRKTDSGVFVVAGGTASVVHARDFDPAAHVEFAIQASPRLVVNGEVLKLKPQWDRRTALGVSADGRHVLVAVVSLPVSLDTLAHAMRDELGCPYALNLDGGSSTQLWSDLPGVTGVPGFSVANGVLAVPREPPR